MKSIYKIIEEFRQSGVNTALCTILYTKGSTPLKRGAKMLVSEKGEVFGTVGGGDLEKKTIENALSIIRQGTSEVFEHNLLQQHGMCCGGILKIFIEPILTPNVLYIFGAGHVGRALAQSASNLDFDVYVVDERMEEMNKLCGEVVNKLPFDYLHILPSLTFSKNTYIAILTYNHQLDREILAFCMKKDFAYLGMIGSKRKVELTKKMFLSTMMYSEDELARVDMPMGFDISANQPAEIAISILAKMISIKNNNEQRANSNTPRKKLVYSHVSE